ncbi:MAG: NADH-quinone oxidoreductase subunit J, partial [Mycobacterium sp.]
GGYPTTLPNPGVYARHNAVDVPARLPDGSASELSVSAILQLRSVPSDEDGDEDGDGDRR